MNIAFVSMSIATAALVFAIWSSGSRNVFVIAGLVFLAVWIVTPIVAALIPIDPPGVERTGTGAIHAAAGGIGFLCLTLGIALNSIGFARLANWKEHKTTFKLVAVLIVFAWLAGALTIPTESAIAGLVQRIMLIIVCIWYLIVCLKLQRD